MIKPDNILGSNFGCEDFVNQMSDLIFLIDLESNIVIINKSAHLKLNISSENRPKKFQDLFYNKVDKLLTEAMISEKRLEFRDFKNDKPIIIQTTIIPVKDDQNKVKHYIVKGTNLNDSILKDSQIQTQRSFLNDTVDNLPAVFYAKDTQGRFISVNSAFRTLFQWTNEDVISKSHFELFPPEIAQQFHVNDQEVIQSRDVIESEEVAFDHLGRERAYHSFKFPYINQQGEVYAVGGASLDITDKKNFEKQAYHNSRLAAIGEMAAGIGHEINNPLAIIKGFLIITKKLLSKPKIDKEKIINKIDKMDLASSRIENIVRGLRTFSRTETDEITHFNPVEVLQESIDMLTEIYERNGIAISLNNQAKTSYLFGNRGRWQQIIMNLFSNARDALENIPQKDIVINTKVENQKFILEFRDSGHGIPDEIKDKVFNPFFTTKEVNKGTGIGLSMVHTIVQQFDGQIEVASNAGTTFTLVFPCELVASDSNPPLEPEKSIPVKNITGQKILVVDDEEDICELLSEILEGTGYNVTKASNGKEALDILNSKPDYFDLIATDVRMPMMDGVTLLDEFKRLPHSSRTKFIFITGGTNIDIEKEYSSSIDGYIYKPFDEEKILSAVGTVLEPVK